MNSKLNKIIIILTFSMTFILFIIIFPSRQNNNVLLNKKTGVNVEIQKNEDRPTINTLLSSYSKLPLYFIENSGQVNKRVKFYVKENNQRVFFTRNSMMLLLFEKMENEKKNKEGTVTQVSYGNNEYPQSPNMSNILKGTAIEFSFLDSAQVYPEGTESYSAKVSYFRGNNPENWKTAIPTYKEIAYREIYDGIDIFFHGNAGRLKYDIAVSPGSDIGQVKIACNGAEGLEISDSGDLIVNSSIGKIEILKPESYQIIDGEKQTVQVSYRLTESNTYGFSVDGYNPEYPLIIDPILSYSTYLGGSVSATAPVHSPDDRANSILVDDATGEVYIAGETECTDFPVTPGAFQTTYGGGDFDITVTKLNSTGTAIIFSTFLGGTTPDEGNTIAFDSAGNVYVIGITYANDYPTTPGCFQPVFAGGMDTVVSKLSPDGTSLIYSTYVGGSNFDRGYGLLVDSSGNAYISGWTESTDFPVTAGAFQTTNNGLNDIYVAKLNPSGSSVIYSTYIGGSNSDSSNGLGIDSSGNAYVPGWTRSSDFPVTAGAFQTTHNGTTFGAGLYDVTITKLNASGTALVYSTFLGGHGKDECRELAVTPNGLVYITGWTQSTDFPTTPGAVQTANAGLRDVFITKLNFTGSALLYSTYLGGPSNDFGRNIVVDSAGRAYVVGYTKDSTTDFPTTPDALQTTNTGEIDVFVAKLSPSGKDLVYSTMLGGWRNDYAHGIDIDNTGSVYVAGNTNSWNFPTTPGAYQPTYAGAYDFLLFKIEDIPTFIELSSFKAKQKRKKIIIKWKTSSEIDNLGFNILRSDSADGEYTKINKKLIPAEQNAVSGAKYKFKDKKVKKGNTYYYKLEDIDKTTGSTLHGPAEVKVNKNANKKKRGKR